jgi:DNA-directed RNA polymerase specialized sigma24 family protein
MSDAELLARFDELVLLATRGDRDAIGAIALAFTGDLLAEATLVLDDEHDAADAVQDFFLALLEGMTEDVVPLPGQGKAFLLALVRRAARRRRWERRRLL